MLYSVRGECCWHVTAQVIELQFGALALHSQVSSSIITIQSLN